MYPIKPSEKGGLAQSVPYCLNSKVMHKISDAVTFDKGQKLKETLAAIITLLLMIPAQSTAAVSSPFFGSAFWKNFDWNNVEQSALYVDPDFLIKNIESEQKKVVYEKFKDVKIGSREFVQSVLRHKNKADERTFNFSLKGSKESLCNVIKDDLEKGFGKKYIFVDNSFDGAIQMRSNSWQWKVGSTLVSLSCDSIGKDDKFASVDISFSPNNVGNEIQTPFSLSCSRNISYIVDGASKKLKAMQFIVLPEKRVWLTLDRMFMGKVTEVSSSEISFPLDADGLIVELTINRYNGNLTGSVESAASGNLIANIQGDCTKIEKETRAF